MSVSNDVAGKRRELEQAEAELRRIVATLGELGVVCIYDQDMQPGPFVKQGTMLKRLVLRSNELQPLPGG